MTGSVASRQVTERQKAILRGLAAGRTTDEIAETLWWSVRTIKDDIEQLGFRTRPQAVAEAIRRGWIS